MFYHFRQNNSGGMFAFNEKHGISVNVIIEASDSEDAQDRFEKVGGYFDGVENQRDCECCGDRWSRYDAERVTDEPCVYGTSVAEYEYDYKWIKEADAETFVHYLNGKVEAYGVHE